MRERTLAAPQRFAFGRNWRKFVDVIDEGRVDEAERSLTTMLGLDDLRGRSFLDIGCGSGLFSLAAARLGARSIHSFDFDFESVLAAEELRARQIATGRLADVAWTIERGDATDASYVGSLGQFDVVYAWGVLHHTGTMWQALENATAAVAPGGLFFVSVYNDQGFPSKAWLAVKKLYNRLPRPLRVPYAVAVMLPFEGRAVAGATLRGRLRSYFAGWISTGPRGMSRWHDLLDWVGGYPFEVAKPEDVFQFCRGRGFELVELTTRGGGLGCNEFVFRRRPANA